MSDTLRLSYSAIKLYNECAKKYKLKYVDKLRERQFKSSLFFGTAIDEGLNALLSGKENYLDIFLSYLDYQEHNKVKEHLLDSPNVKYAKGDIDANLISSIPSNLEVPDKIKFYNVEMIVDHVLNKKDLTDQEQKLFNYFAWESLRQKGLLLLQEYKKEILPKIKRIVEIQGYFSVENETDDALIGYLDMVCEWEDGRIVIFDHKTSSRSYKEDSVKNSEQLATYLFALGEKYKTTNCGYIVLEKNIRVRDPKVRLQVIIDEIPVSFVDSTIDNYDKTVQDIKQGKFEENLKSCYGPFGKCSYYELCHHGSKKNLVDMKK